MNGAYYVLSKSAGVKENLFWLLYSLDDGEFHSQKQICLTEAGAAYTRKALKDVYEAEESALKETLSQCSPSFISDLALFTEN